MARFLLGVALGIVRCAVFVGLKNGAHASENRVGPYFWPRSAVFWPLQKRRRGLRGPNPAQVLGQAAGSSMPARG